MRSTDGKSWPCRLIFTFLLLGVMVPQTMAQRHVLGYAEIGNNVVSRGTFIRTGIEGAHEWKGFKLDGGIQTDLVNYHGSLLTGAKLRIGRQFTIKGFAFDLRAIGMFTRFSKSIQEYNWGIFAGKEHNHWSFGLGTNFRTLVLTDRDGVTDPQPGDFSIHENWNVLYRLGYRIMPTDHPWNATVCLTNIDRFTLGQEMNPGLTLTGEWEFHPSLRAFLELRPVRAGAFNLSVTYFGYLLRAGVQWNITSK